MNDLRSDIDSAAGITWHATWQAALLAAIVFTLCAMLRDRLPARWKAALWLVVLARFVLPVVPPSPTSLFNLAGTWRSHGDSPFDASDAGISRLPKLAARSELVTGQQSSRPIEEQMQSAELLDRAPSSILDWRMTAWRLACLVWLAGAGVLLLRLAISQIRLRRMLRSCDHSADPALSSLVASCRAELRLLRSVRLLLAPRAISPAVFGVWRPTIILPQKILQTLSAEELRPVVLHELAHVRRRDMLVHWLAEIARAVHWFNPVAWLAVRQVAALQELACDEDVLARLEPELQAAYGRSILKVAESLRSPSPLPSALGAAHSFGLLKGRISAIANYRPSSRLKSCFACLILVALIATGLTDASSPWTYGDESPNRDSARDSILQTWKQRESQCASVRFEWKQVVHAQAEALLPQQNRAAANQQRHPGQMITVEQNCSLGLDGERWDFKLDTVGGKRVDGPLGYRDTFDGMLSWNYSGTSAPGSNGTGTVVGPKEKSPLSAYSLPPFLFARLGMPRPAVIDLDRAELADESYLIDGVKCRMLHVSNSSRNPSEQRLYVDVNKECLVRRYEIAVDGRPRLTFDIDYVSDPQLGSRPAKWRLRDANRDGSTLWETVCTVTQDDFHTKFKPDDFMIPYREGTLVEDRTAGRTSTVRVGNAGFIPAALKARRGQNMPVDKSAAGTKPATGKREE